MRFSWLVLAAAAVLALSFGRQRGQAMSYQTGPQFLIDDMGYLWFGPCMKTEFGLRYKRFEGVSPVTLLPRWQPLLWEEPPDCAVVTLEDAARIIDLYTEYARAHKES